MPFKKGQSGNPLGRRVESRGIKIQLQKEFGSNAEKLVARLKALVESRDPQVSLNATKVALSYQVGLPTQAIDLGQNPDREPTQITFRVVRS